VKSPRKGAINVTMVGRTGLKALARHNSNAAITTNPPPKPLTPWPPPSQNCKPCENNELPNNEPPRNNIMAKTGEWAIKVLAVIKSGNLDAAIAQIKVAPTVKDLNQLKAAMIVGGSMAKHKNVEAAVNENLQLLSAPRLHRSP